MAQVIVTESSLENIASAIRGKLNTQDTYKPSEMAGAISQIHGDPVLEALDVRVNGTYTPSSGKDGFSRAVVNVPNSYTASDEGKVVSNGALVAQSSQGINSNGTYDTTLKNQVVVNVPNSYSASDEGKVVDNGALVAQTSQTVTENGTYDTTLKNQVTVNVSGGSGGSGDSVYFKFGASSAVIKADTFADVGSLSSYGTDYIVPCDSEGANVKLDLSQPFEICCKFKLTASPGSTPRNIWGSTNSYYHCPSLNVSNSKIGYNVSTNGSSWAYDGTAITPSGWSCPLNTFITVKMTWDGIDFTFYVNDGTSEYTATLQNITPYYNANYTFAFGSQNKSQYSIAAIGAVIDLNNTYLKQNNTKIWYSVAMLIEKTITDNGTYNAEDDNADGYSQVVVNVSGGGASPKVIDSAIELVVARNDGVFDEDEGVYVASGRTIEYDLGAANTDFTVYLVGKSVPTSGTSRLLMSPYSSGTGNYCGFFRKNTHLWTSTYNNDDDLNIDANDVYIIAMSMDNTTKKIKFFANGSKVNEENFSNSASKIVLGGDSGYYETLYCYYFAVVASAQSESEILSNLTKINDNYINGQGGGGTVIPSFANDTWLTVKPKDSISLYSVINKALTSSKYNPFPDNAIAAVITYDEFLAAIKAKMFFGYEYYGYIDSNLISAADLILLGDFSQGGQESGNSLLDSIENYSAVLLQGVYTKQSASGYNTTRIYVDPQLNASYWTGMKDRNSSYDCNVTFTDNTHVSLTGNRQVIIYGIA